MSSTGPKRSGTSGRKGLHSSAQFYPSFCTAGYPPLVHHAGDLIALGSKPSSSKSLRHTPADIDDSGKPSKSSNSSGGNPSKKFKPAAVSSDNSGGLFSDPIRVAQVGQQAAAIGKQVPSSKSSHGHSPQPSSVVSTQQIIEGTSHYA